MIDTSNIIRQITPLLFTAGIDAGKRDTAKVDPTKVIYCCTGNGLHGLSQMAEEIRITVLNEDDPPSLATLTAWIKAGVPTLRNKEKLMVVCKDGSHRSCMVAGLIWAVAEGISLREIYQTMHDLFISQDMHNWQPKENWKAKAIENWSFIKGGL